ncbi:glycosyl transferase [Ornatilinea apprima]|uniref:Glycosyl transferase n=1 Tax=Ornatilinea apprima TaxID=1134406 RepID=A0A0P6WVT1_9CHLR|nr:glycosyltransferase family 2 protein [Ornatilinea apprima]KPL70051.1 glycosyl transferase [Ornatilinea apprima]
MVFVSVIVPCYNEQTTIRLLLDAVYQQSYQRDQMEVIIADGMSTDGTRAQIQAFQAQHPDLLVKVVDNTRRIIPAALNRAIEAASGSVIVRLDAHSRPDREYVARSVADLEAGLGDNVGGVWMIQPGADTWVARSIAVAASHPLGVGDALYRFTDTASEVDTAPFGAFRRELVERIGFFDETLLTNEDYEFNTRIRLSGGRVWLDPQIRSEYFARKNYGDLAKQYWRYGYWKLRMLRRYPKTLRWRQALPPLFVLSLVGLAILALFWHVALQLLILEAGFYLGVLLTASVPLAARHRDPRFLIGVPAAVAVMHLCWGAGFLWSGIQSIFSQQVVS